MINSKNLNLASVTLIILGLSGCMFTQPDYLQPITVNQLNQKLQAEDIFLVDVHTPKQKHIVGTDLFVPYNQVDQYIDQFPADKNTAIYIYCEGGPMGNAAARKLHQQGYKNLFNLQGGANAWRKAGLQEE